MTGILPNSIDGATEVTGPDGTPLNPAPQNGLYLAQGDAFRVNGGLYYLNTPSVGGSCGGRITPMQINAIVSEILCLMKDFNPTGHYDPTSGCNLAAAFDAWRASSPFIPLASPSDVGKMLVVQSDGSTKWATDADIAPIGAVGPHVGWRVHFHAGADASSQFTEIEFREVAGVRQQSTGGANYQSSRLSPGYDASYAFDGSLTGNYWTPGTGGDQFVGYNHPVARSVVEVAIYWSSVVPPNGAPSDFDIEYSDDGVTWVSALHVTGLTFASWTNGGWNVFSVPYIPGSQGARINIGNARDVNFPKTSGNNGKLVGWNNSSGKFVPYAMASVAFSGNYADLAGLPTIPSGVQLVPAVGAYPNGDVLTIVSGAPAWATPSGGGGLPAIGANPNGYVLTIVSGAAAWAAGGGGGGGSADPAVAVPSAPGAGYVRLYALAPLIPIMTSNTAPSGTASSGSHNDSSNDAYFAFGGPASSGWVTATYPGSAAWISYQFAAAKTVKAYKVTPWSNDTWNGRVATGWTFEGSNNGSTWTTLDTRSIPVTRWQQGLSKTFVVGSPGSYTYYRLNISSWNGDSRVGVNRLQMYGEETPASGDDMALFLIDENSRMTPIRID